MEGSHKRKTVIDIDTVPLQKNPQTSTGSYFGLPKTTKIAIETKKKMEVKTATVVLEPLNLWLQKSGKLPALPNLVQKIG